MPHPRTPVYVWEFPVRFTHWMFFLVVLALSFTGYYIGRPFLHALSTQQYIMGWMRFIHFVSGYVLLVSVILRIYWAFAGNRYASWRVLVPLRKQQLRDMAEAAKFYFFIKKEHYARVGHGPLASLCYLVVLLLFLFEIFSGFALYSRGNPGFFIALLGGSLPAIMDPRTIRIWHHLAMYLILVFAIIHIYIGWLQDRVEKNGVMGSIFGGYKFVTEKEWE